MITIRVPCSSANIGPGFDAFGVALSIYLEVQITVNEAIKESTASLNCILSYEGNGSHDKTLLQPDANLISRTAISVLQYHGQSGFPFETRIHIINPIPLGRGLGSSGSAICAGVILANEVGSLGLNTKAQLLEHCLIFEPHPDNIGPALIGGLLATFLKERDAEESKEAYPTIHSGRRLSKAYYRKVGWAKEIRAVVVVPEYEVKTADARRVLPHEYSRQDAISNFGRLMLLPTILGESPPDPDMIHEALSDTIHQPYRASLVPGLTEILSLMSPKLYPGLLGCYLSGSGPTVVALAVTNFESIATTISEIFMERQIVSNWHVLELVEDGATVDRG